MKKALLFLMVGLLFVESTLANTQCLLVKENNHLMHQEGDCTSRHAPHCSFNLALSLMGFNEGLLVDETHPELPFQEGYLDYVDNWKQAHNPQLWMKHSCVWYSRLLTQKLGMDKFKAYIK